MATEYIGTVYLLHFADRGPGGARHYLGWTTDIDGRLDAHRAGRGARLTCALRRLGISFSLVWTDKGRTRTDERRLKRRKNHARLCPLCRQAALERHKIEEQRRRRRLAAAPDTAIPF